LRERRLPERVDGEVYSYCSSFCSSSSAELDSGSNSRAFLQLLMAFAVSPFN
jgi:hypothetical protein